MTRPFAYVTGNKHEWCYGVNCACGESFLAESDVAECASCGRAFALDVTATETRGPRTQNGVTPSTKAPLNDAS